MAYDNAARRATIQAQLDDLEMQQHRSELNAIAQQTRVDHAAEGDEASAAAGLAQAKANVEITKATITAFQAELKKYPASKDGEGGE